MMKLLEQRISEHRSLFEAVANNQKLKDSTNSVAKICVDAIQRGNKIIFCGNGGSMTDAMHAAAELSGRYLKNRRPLAAIALATNLSSISAIANDFGYEEIFEREVIALGKKGDVFFGISTSGKSKNVLRAMEAAKKMGIISVGLIGGNTSSPIATLAEHTLSIPSDMTPRIQECHIFLLHHICEVIENSVAD